MRFLSLIVAIMANMADAAALEKRCRPAPSPDYHGGYYRLPCWLNQLPSCQGDWPDDQDLTLNVTSRTATASPISAECASMIAIELGRECQGLKPWGWATSEGSLEMKEKDTLVISNMTDESFTRYQGYACGSQE
jgi:hypothetical protein